MSQIVAPGLVYSFNLPTSRKSLRSLPSVLPPPSTGGASVRLPSSAVKPNLFRISSSSQQNPKPSSPVGVISVPRSSEPFHDFLKSAVVLGAGTSFLSYLLLIGGGSGGGEGDGGGGGGGGGDFWSRLFCPQAVAKDDDPSQEWDSHGLPANIIVQLNKLSGFKKYKVSDIRFFDRRRNSTSEGTEDSFFEMVSLRPGGITPRLTYRKSLKRSRAAGCLRKLIWMGRQILMEQLVSQYHSWRVLGNLLIDLDALM